MRLIGAVKRLEGAAAAREEAAGGLCGIAWTSRDWRVDAMELAEGEFIAVDITRRGGDDGAAFWCVNERVTLDASDLGVFYQLAGGAECGKACEGCERAAVGRVVAIDTDMVRYALDADIGVEHSFVRTAPADWR